MATYGKTWWGKKWLETFSGIDDSNRLSKGRTYATKGRAYNVTLRGNTITAKVLGSKPKPYNVEIHLQPFDEKTTQIVLDSIIKSPAILSALINKQLPEALLEELEQHKIQLFPSCWQEVRARCNCSDDTVPCKHIASIIYLMSLEIDKNPFAVFHVRNCDLLELIKDFNHGQLNDVYRLTQIEELFKTTPPSDQDIQLDHLKALDFSKLVDNSETILTILKDSPPFHDKNFKHTLYLVYKQWQRYPQGHFLLGNKSSEDDFKEEDSFLRRWNMPQQWLSLKIHIDSKHQVTKILNQDSPLFEGTKHRLSQFVHFLRDLPNALLHQMCPEIRFVHMLFQFCVKLMETSSLIPQVLQNAEKETLIRWLPALFDDEIKHIYSRFVESCPPCLIHYDNFPLFQDEQVKVMTSLILSGLMIDNLPPSVDKNSYKDLFGFFFLQQPTLFNKKEIPSLIHQWTSRLYLCERNYQLYLMIEETEGLFYLSLQASLKDSKTPAPLEIALESQDSSTRLAILADLALVFEQIPKLKSSVKNGMKTSFKTSEFSPLFLQIVPVLKAVGIQMILPKSLQKILKPHLSLNLRSKEKIKADRESFLKLDELLSFDWKIAIGDTTLSISEFKKLVDSSHGIIRMVDQFVVLNEKEMQSLLKQIEKLPEQMSQGQLMQAALSKEFNGALVNLDEETSVLFKDLENYQTVSLPENLKATLRPYQERGFNWLIQNIKTGFGSILADDMGLGKTLQVIAAMLYLKNLGAFNQKEKALVIAPTSLLSNWKKEIEKFAPDLKLEIYHGNNRELSDDYEILITSYGLARRDKKELSKYQWLLLIVDEAQNIKNPNTEQTKAIKSINAKHKIAISGTPVENRLLEYWSIFDFTNKHYLGTPKQFKEKYASPIEKERNQECLDRFKNITRPFILRRLKADKSIIGDLPDKIEANRYCSLTSEQAALYQEVVNVSLKKIDESQGIERKGLVLKLINSLKQICNHPAQFGKKSLAAIDQSGKMEMLEEILLEINSTEEKSLIFTQYVEMGALIASLMEERFKMPVPFLHGGLSRAERDEMIYEFQHLSNVRTFIISLKAGGTGLNLTAASHVIHYDLWWNPAVEAQATDRAYRIGQQKNVMVHRLLTTGTFEETIDEMIKSKKELADLTVSSGENWITQMTTQQLKELVSLKQI